MVVRWVLPDTMGEVAGPHPGGRFLGHHPVLGLLDPQTRDRPTDHQLLDLLGAFEDVVGLSWTYPLVTAGPVCTF